MLTTLTRLVAAAAALVAAAPVLAQAKIPSMAVSHAGLDLSSPEGRATLERRIARATKRVCAIENSRELTTLMRERRCIADSRKRSGAKMAALFAKHDRVRLAQAGASDAGPAR